MAGLKRPKFHYAAFNEFRKQQALAADLEQRGHAIAQAAGGEPDFLVVSDPTGSRARVLIITATAEAMEAEATRRALTNALSAGRG